jgi:phage protein D
VQLVRAVVRHQLNRVPVATLTFVGGDMPEQTFPLSDGDDFKPGAEITLEAGWGEQEEVIFKGIVVKHGIRISGGNDGDDGKLIVECRDMAGVSMNDPVGAHQPRLRNAQAQRSFARKTSTTP